MSRSWTSHEVISAVYASYGSGSRSGPDQLPFELESRSGLDDRLVPERRGRPQQQQLGDGADR
ncbi:hypothetical protein [Streptomyces tailanensis]|uniref:hypothetical protein n=1 Tax=Streptomyces tailanensis TaxID=2569858 RepID=UPI00122E8C65|nr:hypothetical protein [Streptomyces tailanensis]